MLIDFKFRAHERDDEPKIVGIIRGGGDHRGAKRSEYLVGESNPRREVEDGGVHDQEWRTGQKEKPSTMLGQTREGSEREEADGDIFPHHHIPSLSSPWRSHLPSILLPHKCDHASITVTTPLCLQLPREAWH